MTGLGAVMANLGRMTSAEAAAGPGHLLVPLGATEQHGPHLPLDTDSQIASAWANAVAERSSGWIVSPLIPFGSSGEHQGFPGTLSVGVEVLRSLVVELVRSAAHDFDRVALLSGHGGNFVPVTEATKQLNAEGHDVRCLFPHWPDWADIDAHAGCTETSIMLHLNPDVVQATRIATGQTAPVNELMSVMRSEGIAAVSPSGVLGDPRMASAELGRQLFDDLVARTVNALG